GILTISEKWKRHLSSDSIYYKTEDYLKEKFPAFEKDSAVIYINGAICPTKELVSEVKKLKEAERLVLKHDGKIITVAECININSDYLTISEIECTFKPTIIKNLWDIFSKNGEQLLQDFELLTKGRKSQPISKTNQVIKPENIFLEEGAIVECAILNASSGPIYVGKDAEIMEGSIVRGGLALCEHSALKLGAKIYGPTTIGPYSKVGGEVTNSVILGYSNKGHDGFLGNSVLGEWCNIGADSNNSNLKNNYAEVKLWNYPQEKFVGTGLQFCGLIMGDHSKCGINTMFNTGTVVGVSANIFGAGFPRNFLPSFSWGGAAGITTYRLKDAIETAERVYERRGKKFDEVEQKIFAHVFEQTEKFRK
ncbi:MAG: GlmU family protein, partial [Bacteroidetes bacterium]|nr:GlmU family protein [Bacteroidota bacterium]